MRFISGLIAFLAAVVALAAGAAALISFSAIALVVCLLALILLFIAASATRRKPALSSAPSQPTAPVAAQPRPISDRERLRRAAARLGVEPKREVGHAAAENEEAANAVLKDVLSRARKSG